MAVTTSMTILQIKEFEMCGGYAGMGNTCKVFVGKSES